MYASFRLRFKAFMIDYILILSYLGFLFIASVFLFPSLQELFKGSLVVAQFSGFIMVTLPVSLYFIISDSKNVGQSFGKRKSGIKVVKKSGEAVPLLQMAFRTILKLLPWEFSHFLVYRLIDMGDGEFPFTYTVIGGLIYALMFSYILTCIFTKRKQSIYDLLAKTYVLKVQ
ncbi:MULTISPECIES: RDD family protein [unclassified Fredinandcohnia]|uniref:RDD family protein n=1 Tax=unclassified Fredinandcohnia TaxID=2837514 RepID=UPI0030FD5A1A